MPLPCSLIYIRNKQTIAPSLGLLYYIHSYHLKTIEMKQLETMKTRLTKLIITQSLYPYLDLSKRMAAMRNQIRLCELSLSKRGHGNAL